MDSVVEFSYPPGTIYSGVASDVGSYARLCFQLVLAQSNKQNHDSNIAKDLVLWSAALIRNGYS